MLNPHVDPAVHGTVFLAWMNLLVLSVHAAIAAFEPVETELAVRFFLFYVVSTTLIVYNVPRRLSEKVQKQIRRVSFAHVVIAAVGMITGVILGVLGSIEAGMGLFGLFGLIGLLGYLWLRSARPPEVAG